MLVISRQKIYEMGFGDYSAFAFGGEYLESRVRRALGLRFGGIECVGADGDVDCFAARDNSTGSVVGLRVLSEPSTSNYGLVERFRRRARAAAKLRAPNILGSSEASEARGVHFCTVELRPDLCTLRQMLDSGAWLPIERAVEIADQIAGGLAFAHQLGVLHTRLTPRNILIENNEWVLINRFGVDAADPALLVKIESLDRHYASPEQLAGQNVDHRSDLYSLGAILYEMFTDRAPIDCAIFEDSKARFASHLIPPPDIVRMDVPQPVSEAVMRLLEYNPHQRPESAAEFQWMLYKAMRPQRARAVHRP